MYGWEMVCPSSMERAVHVSLPRQSGTHEAVARHLGHGPEDARVGDAALLDLQFHQAGAA